MTERADIVAYARSLIGTPFRHQGRLPGVAVDCIGLVVVTAWELGLKPRSFDYQGYARSPDGTTLLAECDKHMQRIQRTEMTIGDVVVIRWGQYPQHFGIVADYRHGGLSMIHAYQPPGGGGKVIEHRLATHILEQMVAAYRLPGVA